MVDVRTSRGRVGRALEGQRRAGGSGGSSQHGYAPDEVSRPGVRAGLVLIALVAMSCSTKAKVAAPYSAPPAPRPATGAAPWPRPNDTLARAQREGLTPQRKESFTFHIHVLVDIFVNGRAVALPSGLGIDIRVPGVRTGPLPGGGTGYGGISLCASPCIAPLHTHDPSGIVHVESPEKKDYTLGQFFNEWAVRLDGTCVGGYCAPQAKIAVFINGKRHDGNPADIVFVDHDVLAIVVGSPPAQIPATFGNPDV